MTDNSKGRATKARKPAGAKASAGSRKAVSTRTAKAPKAPRKPKPTAPKGTGAGDRILLGFETSTERQPVGFASRTARAPQQGAPVWLEGEGHMITIAPTGAGKGRGCLIPNLLTYEGPAIVIDPKGEACAVTARRRREMGQDVRIIDPFGVISDKTDSLNPLDIYDVPGIDNAAVSMQLANLLSGGHKSLKDPFWDIRGTALLAGVISAVATINAEGKRNFGEVRNKLMADDVVYNLAVILDTVGKKLHRFAYEEIASFVSIEDRCRSGILATATSYLTLAASDGAQKTMMDSTIDLDAVIRGDPMTIYLVVPPPKLATHGALFRMWTSCLLQALMSRTTTLPEHRTLVAIDECSQLGDFTVLPMIYTLARSYGVRVWSFFQDLQQLRRNLPEEWMTVLNNTAAMQTFGVSTYLMGRDLNEILGDFSEDHLRRMPRDRLALVRSGERGRELRRPDYLTDEMFEGLFDPHPIMGQRKPRR